MMINELIISIEYSVAKLCCSIGQCALNALDPQFSICDHWSGCYPVVSQGISVSHRPV